MEQLGENGNLSQQEFILTGDEQGGGEEGLILHICTTQIRISGVCNRRHVSEYNPLRQMSGLSDGSDAQSYKRVTFWGLWGNTAERAFI